MKKNTLKQFIYPLACGFLLSVSVSAQTKKDNKVDQQVPGSQFKLLPLPKKTELLPGKPLSFGSLQSVYLDGLSKKPVMDRNLSGLKDARSAAKGVITLKLAESAELPASGEGYVLEIKNDQVTISSRNEAGLFYGCKTLSQLLQDARDQNINIPSVKITDYPDIDYRAIHLDLKHHVDSVSYYYSLMDRLADVKVNAVIIEFEDKLKYTGAPVIAAPHSIPIEDFAAISEYAKDRNIEISPLVQGLGHASFILKHPEYKELRDDQGSDWSFDPLNPKTYDLQFSLYKDAIAATPQSRYLHVGGDEVGKLGLSELAKKSGMKPFELQMYWLKKVCDFAKEQNRIPIFWDDMVFKLSDLYETTYDPSISEEEVQKRWKEKEHVLNENIQLFPKNCVYMRWNYDYPGILGNRKALEWYKSHNLAVMAATAGQQIWAMMPRANSNFIPVKEFSKITANDKLNGILLTLWDDASPHFETYWRGIYDYALFTWNYQDLNKEAAHTMFRHRFYGPGLSSPYFEFQDTLEQAMPFWETALINSGNREVYPDSINTLTLPDASSPGAWSKKNQDKLINARKEIVRYTATKQKIAKALKTAKRNKYSLEIFDQLNEFQIYASELLVRLDKYDRMVSPKEKKEAAAAVKSYVNNFPKIRKRYENVITKTRVLQNPADYLPDQNHHNHLANGTVNNDWMFVYELAINDSILKALPE